MNSSDATRQPVSSCPGWDLIQAIDLLDEITNLQRFISIAGVMVDKHYQGVHPDVALLLDTYLDQNIPEKLQAANELIEGARKAIA